MKIKKSKILITILSMIIILGQVPPLKLIAADYAEFPTTGGGDYEEVYETVEDYLKVYYEGYEKVDKSEITEIVLDSLDRCIIKDFSGIYEYPNLTILNFWGFDINLNLNLSKLPNLKELGIVMATISSIDLSVANNLEELVLRYVNFRNIDKLDLSKIKLKTLRIEDVYYENESEEIYGPITVKGIENSTTQLEYLSINIPEGIDTTDIDFSSFKNLKTLEIAVYTSGIMPNITGISQLTELENLNLWGGVFNEKLSSLKKLKSLSLGNIYKEKRSYEFKDVKELEINALNAIEKLELEYITCSDDTILSNFPSLKYLVLSDITNPIDESKKDFSKLEIEKLKNLIYLEISDLNSSLLLSNNTKLEGICIYGLEGDFSNKQIDIRNLNNLKEFYLGYNLGKVTGFEAEKCILSNNELEEHTDGEGYFVYSWYPDYFESQESYITENLQECILGEETALYGFELTNNKVTIQDLSVGEYFEEGIEYKIYDASGNQVTNTNAGLGTGTKIVIYEDEIQVKEYIVVIYGDTSGDGQITPSDALTLIKAVNKKVQLSGIEYWEAGRVKSAKGKKASAVDALAIIKHLNNKYEIQQSV